MLYLAVVQSVAVLLALVAVASLSRHVRAESRAHVRREDALLDKLMHATGKTWTPPPSDKPLVVVPDPEYQSWTPSPEQLPAA